MPNLMTRTALLSIVALLFIHAADAQLGFGAKASQNVKVELLAEQSGIQPGSPFTVGVRFELEPDWHIYWYNMGPGVGLPTEVEWELPEGFTAGPLQWPAPDRFITPAGDEDLISYGYHDEVMLMAVITPPTTLEAGSSVELKATVSWLACKESCIPGSANPALTLPVVADVAEVNASHRDLFVAMRAKLPVTHEAWEFSATRTSTDATLIVPIPEAARGSEFGEITFFPEVDGVFDAQRGFSISEEAERIVITLPYVEEIESLPERIGGVLTAANSWGDEGPHALLVDIGIGSASSASAAVDLAAPASLGTILLYLLMAFGGGILLNLMPCVLPVLSIKVMDFVKQAGDEAGHAWRHGVVFLAGVLVSFWAIAAVVIGLKVAGMSVGWAFQFQYPGFVYALVAVLFVFGLSLFGIFEVGLALTTVGGEVTHRSGLTGSFFSGLLATVVATPCMAPAMAPAVAFGMAQPAIVTVLIFTALGVGMALPYMLLSAFPSLLRFVPRPGAWMETLKQFLGFMLMGAVVWLLWVLAWQVNPDGLTAVLGSLIVLALAAWILGRWATPAREGRVRNLARLAAAILLVGGLWYGFDRIGNSPPLEAGAVADEDQKIAWVSFDPEAIPALRRGGKAVFVDFTARWCLTCQANEKVAFTRAVGERMEALDVVPMKADWTRRDETIAAALAEHGRNGVPLYVLYPADITSAPIILPQLLTEGIVLDALEQAIPN